MWSLARTMIDSLCLSRCAGSRWIVTVTFPASSFDQQLGFAAPVVPAGTPLIMCFLKCTRGKISSGDIWFPAALTVMMRVTKVPLSEDTDFPTYFCSCTANTSFGSWTVQTRVLLAFHIFIGVDGPYFSWAIFRWLKYSQCSCDWSLWPDSNLVSQVSLKIAPDIFSWTAYTIPRQPFAFSPNV